MFENMIGFSDGEALFRSIVVSMWVCQPVPVLRYLTLSVVLDTRRSCLTKMGGNSISYLVRFASPAPANLLVPKVQAMMLFLPETLSSMALLFGLGVQLCYGCPG